MSQNSIPAEKRRREDNDDDNDEVPLSQLSEIDDRVQLSQLSEILRQRPSMIRETMSQSLSREVSYPSTLRPQVRIEFRRMKQSAEDPEVVYTFKPLPEVTNGCCTWAREDNDSLRIGWWPKRGWIVYDAAVPCTTLSLPWDAIVSEQPKEAPPLGVWVSYKNGKSYAYNMIMP